MKRVIRLVKRVPDRLSIIKRQQAISSTVKKKISKQFLLF
ncbi:hypothetical protein UAO_01368 [Enterococcus villorum ATCC 700913]|uniref:Uncharacterized protein n=1 Tax=Enterococcus villorum ATCC 700913 TaxID=1158604 RepID=A0ABN0KH90_9ENTE|nr:hypothetical protein UAO_01368 [Enterococcus villorum ATCC 700913]EOW78353.1 hypothetical protein I591_01209 [Enterococcus villorum ATCC 700913]